MNTPPSLRGAATHAASSPSVPLLVLLTVATGVLAGIGGMALGMLLHLVQRIGFGFLAPIGSQHESFLDIVRAAAPWHRFGAVLVSGLIAGFGWWMLARWGRPLVSVNEAVDDPSREMPPATTVVHDLLQIITVGLGSPLGREVAPRELGVLGASLLSRWARLPEENRRVLVACGAGAGLAAVYNVPFAGALFTLEGLLVSVQPTVVLAALTTSLLATVVSWIGLGNRMLYSAPPTPSDPGLIAWSALIGPLMGVAGYAFLRLTAAARNQAPRNARRIALCLLVFAAIGALSMRYPELLGNGRSIGTLTFNADLTLRAAAILLVLHLAVVLGAFRSGARGGQLTPGFTTGALLGTIGGIVWQQGNSVWHQGNGAWQHGHAAIPLGAFAIIAGVAFLATSMRMPLTAIALGIEITGMDHAYFVPVLVAATGSAAASRLLVNRTAEHPGTTPHHAGLTD